MRSNNRDSLAGILLFAFAVAWCIAVRATVPAGFSSETVGPQAMPFWLGVALGALALILIASAYLNGRTSSDVVVQNFPPKTKTLKRMSELWAISLVGGSVVAYALLMQWFGFVAATIVIVAALLYFGLGVRSIPLILGMSLGLGFGIYIVMDLLMGVYLPHGTVIAMI